MNLSYSGYSLYKDCPKSYFYRYIARIGVRENKVNSLYGSIVGVLFENFYKNKMHHSPTVINDLLDLVPSVYAQLTSETEGKNGLSYFVTFDNSVMYQSKETLLQDVYNTIPNAVKGLEHFDLIYDDVESELVLDSNIEGVTIVGRADFVLKDGRHTYILDGKGTKRPDLLKPTQLWWYSLLYKTKYGEEPDYLGYILWRNRYDNMYQNVEYNTNQIALLKDSIFEAVENISSGNEKDFPTRVGEACRFCNYKDICSAYIDNERASEKKLYLKKNKKEISRLNIIQAEEDFCFEVPTEIEK